MLLGVDTGGTFTDFVCIEGGRVRVLKVLSTPAAPEQAILQGMRTLGVEGQPFYLVHGSTVATNAVLEGKGVRTAYVSNRGLGDLLTIGRQSRRELYNLQPPPEPPPVPPELCFEIGGRLGADGRVVEALDDAELRRLAERLNALGVEAVAVNLLFSYLDEHFECRVEQALSNGLFVSRSSFVLPEQGEYERGIATWMNAWVGPCVDGYLQRLRAAVAPAPLHVMQSAAQTIDAGQAGRRAVNLLLSGPAGGLMGARVIGERLGMTRLLTLDMGGTSTDVALIDGRIRLTTEGRIGRYPVAVPMVDMHTIGAGGGSLARVDEGGMLAVGPESAGAVPGPACYGRGGRQATVTDANLVLGRLRPTTFLGGNLRLDRQAAFAALGRLGAAMGLDAEQAAAGVVAVANEHMAQALRVISIERGIDPAGYALLAFGGAGGLHVCALAEALAMSRALVPPYAGVLSALGMLLAPRGRQVSQTVCTPLLQHDDAELVARLRGLADQGRRELLAEGVDAAAVRTEYSLDLRYQGQRFSLNVPYEEVARAGDEFHRAHRQRFGHALEAPIELVNLRVALSAGGAEPDFAEAASVSAGRPIAAACLAGVSRPAPVWRRSDLSPGQVYPGPLLVVDADASTYVAPGWAVSRQAEGCLLLERSG
jgi:N-methylhydantoinase A